jgi:superfamily II DNA or RNA helicase
MDRPALVGDAVEHYSKLAPGLPAIAFCVSVQHAQDVAAAFQAAGWQAVAVHGAMRPAERDAALDGLASGAVQVVCACDLISEGLDVPAVGAVILLRPTKSLALHLQQIGRGLRPAPGKHHLIVLDHAGNTLVHGFAETPRRWSLNGRPKRERSAAPAVRRCAHCGLVQSGRRSCPVCGYAAPRPTVPKTTIGTLRELRRLAPTMSYREIANGTFTEEELRLIARVRGYRRGWVRRCLLEQAERNRDGGGNEHQRP